MLKFGVTRVELGVQIIDDYIYELTNRGHNVEDVVECFRVAKDAGLKIVAHMMPGLPGSNFGKDLDSFRLLLQDERFRPDMLKIYPCLVMEGTELYTWWKQGRYRPYDTDQAAELIAQVKEFVPPWVRIMRVHREFPVHLIIDGVKNGNLREFALHKLAARGKRCRCIRCREVGHRVLKEGVSVNRENLALIRKEYPASEGTEIFLAKEEPDLDVLIGYIRLRIPSNKAHRTEVDESTAIVRELHVYGPEVPIGRESPNAWQHKGIGQELLAAAECAAKAKGSRRILVLSALGTREYYRNAGYSSQGAYVGKLL
jgi:elongator complex protein 3